MKSKCFKFKRKHPSLLSVGRKNIKRFEASAFRKFMKAYKSEVKKCWKQESGNDYIFPSQRSVSTSSLAIFPQKCARTLPQWSQQHHWTTTSGSGISCLIKSFDKYEFLNSDFSSPAQMRSFTGKHTGALDNLNFILNYLPTIYKMLNIPIQGCGCWWEKVLSAFS